MSPTQRSLAFLRGRGYRVAICEHWNHYAKVRQDLFGIIDLLAIRPGEVLGVQATSYSNVSARLHKIAESEAAPDIRAAGIKIEVHGWHKKGKVWEPRVVTL